MNGLWCAPAKRVEVFAFKDAEDETKGETTRGDRGHGHDMMPAVVKLHWRAPERLIGTQVVVRDNAAALFHGGDNMIGRFTRVESVATRLRNATQCRGQLWCAPARADGQELSVLQEQRPAGGISRKAMRAVFVIVAERGVNGESRVGKRDRRLQQLGPRFGAVLPVCFVETSHRTRHASGQCSRYALVGSVSVGCEIHVARGGLGCGFAEVERNVLASDARHHESAATDIACGGIGHGECHRHGHGRVHRVAAAFEHGESCVAGERRGRDHHRRIGGGDAGFALARRRGFQLRGGRLGPSARTHQGECTECSND